MLVRHGAALSMTPNVTQAPSVSKLGFGLMFCGGFCGGTMPVAGSACALAAFAPLTLMGVPAAGDPRSAGAVGVDEVLPRDVPAATAAGAAAARAAAVSTATRTPAANRRRAG